VKVWRRVPVVAAAAGLLVIGVAAGPTEAGRAHQDVVVVEGDVHRRLRLTAADIEGLHQWTVTVMFQSGTSTQTHTYTGALLLDVLDLAEPDFNPDVKNDFLAHVVSATGSDGYRATVAWGEFDPGFEGKQILIATKEDDIPLGDGGPRLVVPDDIRGGRYVSDVVTLRLIDA
jgi:hypothetical protein